ncbi:SIR2 family NAD-dependent protein deacylase [Natranaerobius thermophilus]|uniref:protein acetyllysine N-acetyltransferase n=1 Tax=Natranaerobius thermophilus (strain ATCC BAA-1301 / DSM 18059 / JW/NM-WN-LF) TaxID=457570 RepID=B2A496_NATTJ|nr:NAD-dependent protein deacylase [Natranaerobius thermophilus]ACB83750.1 Silent information regulator protein Sir2 [Natranaerobius thermophilus JW/NM-WN-LF]
MADNKKFQDLKEKLLSSEEPYVLTGAGISTESGIPDFRGKDGLWTKIDPMQYSTREVLMSVPEKFYEYGFERFKQLANKEPNQGHKILADLEKHGVISGIVTQNIDGLHQKAGSKQVFEVHGNTRKCYCLGCNQEYPFQELSDQLEKEQKDVPKCKECGGMLRPDIILFGDQMPDLFFKVTTVLKQRCDFLLVIGTSLQVYPVAALAELGIPMGIINLEETPFDRQAEVVIQGKCGETLSQLWDHMKDELSQ